MNVRMTICVLMLATTLSSGLALAQPMTTMDAGQCSDSAQSLVQISLSDLGIGPGEHALTLRALLGEQTLIEEHYRVQIEELQKATVLPAWLGGVSATELKAIGDSKHQVRIELADGDQLLASWTLDELLLLSSGSATVDSEEAFLLERRTDEAAGIPGMIFGEEVASNAKGTTICPGAFPQCDIEYDQCEEQCYLDEQCYIQCLEEYDECVYGVSGPYTETTEINRRYGGNTCAFYPWSQFFNPKKWDFWDVVYEVREYNRTYCPRTGHTFDTLVRQYLSNDTCYKKTPFSCSGNASYLGGDCRW